jgi:3-oxoadipate enol-lactonase / 4-carboxymuconolactone decarboxylase
LVPLTPTITIVRMPEATCRAEVPLLVLGPSLGTSALTLWTDCATHLTDAFDVVVWDLPGHGNNRSIAEGSINMDQLGAAVLGTVDEVLNERGELGAGFFYAGDSVGGAVGLQLLLDAPDRVRAAALLCTGSKIGTAELWAERAAQVCASGTASLVSAAADRWFGPGFLDREPKLGSELLDQLSAVSDEGYAQVCGALGRFDVRDRLNLIKRPVLAIGGTADITTPPDTLRQIADGVEDGRYAELFGVGHLAPAEAPEAVADLLRGHFLSTGDPR